MSKYTLEPITTLTPDYKFQKKLIDQTIDLRSIVTSAIETLTKMNVNFKHPETKYIHEAIRNIYKTDIVYRISNITPKKPFKYFTHAFVLQIIVKKRVSELQQEKTFDMLLPIISLNSLVPCPYVEPSRYHFFVPNKEFSRQLAMVNINNNFYNMKTGRFDYDRKVKKFVIDFVKYIEKIES